MCVSVAEHHFVIDIVQNKSFVFQQPTTQEQLSVCDDAIKSCPVQAIKNVF
ncbi:MAG: ferredoxin [Candidatus Thiodubiliella endoseptemdiera]|uniref:Ferredoxin n=1 Tax=Candidatus Thiodubiliella endoseptemdiera TaxID=2738886 RepID=A0A853F176_9GAMM|nr:ferredoxin [Candidatus Thiodubiliella endoseptemdiera]